MLASNSTEGDLMKYSSRIILSFVISFSMVHFPVLKAHAGIMKTTDIVNHMSRTQGESTVAKFLDRTDVKNQLVSLGVNPDDATQRLNKLSDHEVNTLAQDIQKAQAGGDVVGILLIVFLIVGIIYFAKRI